MLEMGGEGSGWKLMVENGLVIRVQTWNNDEVDSFKGKWVSCFDKWWECQEIIVEIKEYLIETHMMRWIDIFGRNNKTSISFMMERISKRNMEVQENLMFDNMTRMKIMKVSST